MLLVDLALVSGQAKPLDFWELESQAGMCHNDRQSKSKQAEGQLSTAFARRYCTMPSCSEVGVR